MSKNTKIKFAKLPKIKYVIEVTIATYSIKTIGHTSSSARVVINRDLDNVKLFPMQYGNERVMQQNIYKFLVGQGILQIDTFAQLENGILYNEHVIQSTKKDCIALGKGIVTTYSIV